MGGNPSERLFGPRAAFRLEPDLGQRARAAPAMQQHGEPQQHDQELRLEMPRRHQLLGVRQVELAPVTSHQRGEELPRGRR